MRQPVDELTPFRWDLVTPHRLGTLLDGLPSPDLWFLDELVSCAGTVLARSGGGDLVFVGRSLDSMHDLLSGVLTRPSAPQRVVRLPFSFRRGWLTRGPRAGLPRPLTPAEVAHVRAVLTGCGLAPHALARRDRPVTCVDVVATGSTFDELFAVLRSWTDDEREPWSVIRTKVRFVGVTYRHATSPNAYRWQQHAEWTRLLPARSVMNVSLVGDVWGYLGDTQHKLTWSFPPEHWLDEQWGPDRDDSTRRALAEAVALVAHGRSKQGRAAVARATAGEPALAEPWLRTLVTRLSGG